MSSTILNLEGPKTWPNMRDYNIIVRSDCIASNMPEDTAYTLRQMHNLCNCTHSPTLVSMKC